MIFIEASLQSHLSYPYSGGGTHTACRTPAVAYLRRSLSNAGRLGNRDFQDAKLQAGLGQQRLQVCVGLGSKYAVGQFQVPARTALVGHTKWWRSIAADAMLTCATVLRWQMWVMSMCAHEFPGQGKV